MKFLLKIMSLVFVIGMLFVTGTIAYHNMEGWGYVDSFYYTGVTLLTIGYGDFVPTQPFSKIFTVFFGITGIGMMLLFITIVSEELYTHHETIRLKAEKKARHFIKRHFKKTEKIKRGILQGSR